MKRLAIANIADYSSMCQPEFSDFAASDSEELCDIALVGFRGRM